MTARIGFRPSPDLYPFQSHWFEPDSGARVHYLDEGSGPPILMCHGNPTWSFLYRKVIIRLRDQFRCVAIDMPGFGLSDRPTDYGYTPAEHAAVLNALVEHLNLQRMVVMTHDWGGPVGMSVAAGSPARVSGLVCMNTTYFPLGRLSGKLTACAVKPAVAALNQSAVPIEVAMRLGTSTPLTRAEIDHYLGVQRTRGDRRAIVELPRHLSSGWLSQLATLVPTAIGGKPTLLIWGMKDPLLGRQSVIRRWRQDFPTADLVALPHANHYIQEDRPQEIADAVVARFGQNGAFAGPHPPQPAPQRRVWES